jgi:hypothetical protein
MWRRWWREYRRRGNQQPRHHSGNLHCDRYWHFRHDYEHGDGHAYGAVAHAHQPGGAAHENGLLGVLDTTGIKARCFASVLGRHFTHFMFAHEIILLSSESK